MQLKCLINVNVYLLLIKKENCLEVSLTEILEKALLNQINKDAPVTKIMNKKPNVFFEPLNYDKIRETFKEGFYEHYPIINQNNQIVGVQNNNELQKMGFDNPIIIMAGGLEKGSHP